MASVRERNGERGGRGLCGVRWRAAGAMALLVCAAGVRAETPPADGTKADGTLRPNALAVTIESIADEVTGKDGAGETKQKKAETEGGAFLLPPEAVKAAQQGAAGEAAGNAVSAGATTAAGAVDEPTRDVKADGGKESSAAARPLGTAPARRLGAGTRGGEANTAGEAKPSSVGAILKNDLVRTTLSLGFVLALIVCMAVVMKKVGKRRAGASLAAAIGPGGASPSGVMEVLGRYPIARGQSLVLLRIHRRVLLMSHTAPALRLRSGGTGGFVTLAEFSDPEEVAGIIMRANEQESESMTAKFRSILGQFERGHEDAGAAMARPDRRASGARGVATRDARDAGDLRLIHTNDSGDRAEIWNDRAVAQAAGGVYGVPANVPVNVPTGREHGRAAGMEYGEREVAGTLGSGGAEDPMGSLRQRLAGLRGRGVQG